MSHQVETMAYTNAVPWHGLGKYKEGGWKTTDALLKDAKINWEVERRDMFDANGVQIPGFAALTRDSDAKVLDVVGSRYIPVQNKDAFDFFKEFVEAGKATLETAGSLKGGRLVWGLAKLNTTFTMSGNDKTGGYLLCACPHEQGKSLLFKMTAVRVVCNNTFSMALAEGGSEWRMGHRTAFGEVKIEEAKAALGIARDQVGEFEKAMRKIQKIKLSNEDVIKVLLPFFGSDVKGAENARMKQLIDIYENAPGAQPGNAYGVFNAVTYYADHVASRTPDKRLTNAWMGRTGKQKEKVMATLLEMA
jgi:phage/plasmid-like protein (TIGR03299 family)